MTDHNGIKEVILEAHILPEVPELMPDGVLRRWRAQCKYTYALERPPTFLESLRAGSSPTDKSTPYTNLFLPNFFSRTQMQSFNGPGQSGQ